MSDQHESPIKTPKQLIIVIVLAFAIPIAIAVLVSQLVTSGRKLGDDASAEKRASLIQPVARIQLAAGGGATSQGQKTGEQVVTAVCGACHTSGVAGAPKIGDNAAWAPRIALGFDALLKSATAGKGAMPPKGGATDLTEAELARSIVFMANKSGADFKEPAATVAATAEPATAAAAAPQPAAAPEAPAAAPAAPAAAAPSSAAAPAAPDATSVDGKSVYEKTCAVCHAAGVAGAPKLGDQAAWAPRIASGAASLLKSALNGKNAMPPKGGNTALSDAEVEAAVTYMVSHSK